MSLALQVARAALLEVGADPNRVWPENDGPMVQTGDAPAIRAMYLGLAAEYGMTHLSRCTSCALQWERNPPACTPVRDVLRGVTCGRPT